MSDAADLIHFLYESPSPFHCVATSAARLRGAGFVRSSRGEAASGSEPGVARFWEEDGTLFAWRVGTAPPALGGFRILLAHTDSPNLRVKPRGEFTREGYRMLGVEKYGGLILATWADRDLGISGRVGVRTPRGVEARLVRIERPVARIPNLAIHLNRAVNDEGLKLNPETQACPVLGFSGEERRFKALVAEAAGAEVGDLLDWELGLHDLQAPVVGGMDGEFVFGARMDNQFSCYAALQALISAAPGEATAVVALYDHEEVGSMSARGARSGLLRGLLRRLSGGDEFALEQALSRSFMVSADMAHGVHPNFADKHEPNHKPMLGGGPVMKTNANVSYASDALSASRLRAACMEREIPTQDFVSRADLACGSTVGPATAAELGLPAVDIGCAMLSMHSVREQACVQDIALYVGAMRGALEL